MKGGDENVKVALILLLLFNLIIIIMQQYEILDLQDKLHQARKDAINEINKLRNGEK